MIGDGKFDIPAIFCGAFTGERSKDENICLGEEAKKPKLIRLDWRLCFGQVEPHFEHEGSAALRKFEVGGDT